MQSQVHTWASRGRQVHGTIQAGMQALLEPMGYPPPHHDGLDDYAERLCRDFARDLTEADLYVMSPTMSDVTVAAAYTLTLPDILALREEDVPSPTGLLVLPRPLLIVNGAGDLNDMRAVAWTPVTIHRPGEPPKPALRIVGLLDTYGPVQHETFTTMLTQARMAGDPFPALMVSGFSAMPFGWERAPTAGLLAHIQATDRQIAAETDRVAARRGWQSRAQTTGEHVSGSHIQDPDGSFLRRFLFAFWRLCEQRVTTVEKAPAGHAATAVASRVGATPDVSIVALRHRRRVNDDDPSEGSHPVAWTTRWTVKMHKVLQWYPSEQTHKVLWRGPYVKGPEGLPLKNAPTVNALVR